MLHKTILERFSAAGYGGVEVSVYDDGTVTYHTGTPQEHAAMDKIVAAAMEPESRLKGELKAQAALRRYEKEISGVKVGNSTIATDRESRFMIASLVTNASDRAAIKFKVKEGFIDLDLKKIGEISTSVADHVQACFELEAKVAADIDKGKIKTPDQVDAAFGFGKKK